VDAGKGITPEQGVGAHGHIVNLNNIYDYKNIRLSSMGKKIVLGGLALGVMQAVMGAPTQVGTVVPELKGGSASRLNWRNHLAQAETMAKTLILLASRAGNASPLRYDRLNLSQPITTEFGG
jgi:hypothetical protein